MSFARNTASTLTGQQESPLAGLCQTRPWVRDFMLTTLFGALTALSAQVAIRVPWSPVPITGQVLMVLLAGGLLGAKLGALSQIEYLAMGLAGLPVFAGGMAGPLAFISPSGGYLIGFVAAAWVVGRIVQGRKNAWWMLLANLCGVLVLYLPGWLWLSVWMGAHQPGGMLLIRALAVGVAPFIWVDLGKVVIATQATWALRRKTIK